MNASAETDVLPPLAPIPVLDRNARVDDVVAALDAAGCALIERAVDEEVVVRVASELKPYRDANEANPSDDWSGARTLRTGGVLHRAPSSHALALHPLVIEPVARVLRRHCRNIQLNNCLVMEVLPGEKPQEMHRDELAWAPLEFPTGMEVVINTMWALTAFAPDNGATIVFPGSHLWARPRTPAPAPGQGIKALMPPGSVFLFTGKCYHGAGANESGGPRVGLSIAYMNGLLRQSENQYLTNPPEVARTFPERLARLVGYSRGGDAIGHYRDIEHPLAAVYTDRVGDFPRGYRFVEGVDAV